MIVPGAVLTPWRDDVQAILASFPPGQEWGNAFADILFGDAAPTGRLPVTFPDTEAQLQLSKQQWPGVGNRSVFSEKMEVGYRHFDAQHLEPAFPFGHGLTYTSFAYSELHASSSSVSFTLTNTGTRDGVETAMLFLAFPPAAGEPPLQLKGFQRVELAAGTSAQVVMALDVRAVSVWSSDDHRWEIVCGNYTAAVGASSRDIRLRADFVVDDGKV